MTILSTNTHKPDGDDAPKPLRHIRMDDAKPKLFNFNAGQFKHAKPHPTAFGRGPIQTSQLREMAENKARLAASAAKKAAAAKLAAQGKPTPKKRRGGRKARKGK